MTWIDTLDRPLHIALAVTAILILALLGRIVARALRQPDVVGEIAAGLLVAPAIVLTGGHELFRAVLPADVVSSLRLLGHVGVVLFLVGVAHELRASPVRPRGRVVAWTTAGSLLIPMLAGGLLAGWVLWTGDEHLRGRAPTVSFVLLMAVSLAVTAVPVLARILVARNATNTRAGHLAMASAVAIDSIAWLLLALAIALAAGGVSQVLAAFAVLAVGVGSAVLLVRLLGSDRAVRWCVRFPRMAALLVAVITLVASSVMQRGGLTEILGAVLVGLGIPVSTRSPQLENPGPHSENVPSTGPWEAVVGIVSGIGLRLVPIFFVVNGINAFAGQFSAPGVAAVLVAIMLGIAGKALGGYAGARAGGESRGIGWEVAVLTNARGLTELVVLQAGYSAGILTPPLFLALVVMALVTTAMTGPLHTLVVRRARKAATEWDALAPSGSHVRYSQRPCGPQQ
jgi:Kef-type K+ transport system membrane component KefB